MIDLSTLGLEHLGYVRRKHADPGTRLRAGSVSAEVVELPFPGAGVAEVGTGGASS